MIDWNVKLNGDMVVESHSSFVLTSTGLDRQSSVSLGPSAAEYGDHIITKNFRFATTFVKAQSLSKVDEENYDYDASGNLIQITTGDSSVMAMSYDNRNQLIAIDSIDANVFPGLSTTSVSYDFDAVGNRIARTTSDGDVFGPDLWSQETNYSYIKRFKYSF